MDKERAFELIQETLHSMKESELIDEEVNISADTILLGVGAPLDSIGFVTFVTKLEDRLIQELNRDIYLVLDDIHEFNSDNAILTVDVLATFIVDLTKTMEK